MQLRMILIPLEGSVIEVSTEYSVVSGVLITVRTDYIVLRTRADLLYIPLTSIKGLTY